MILSQKPGRKDWVILIATLCLVMLPLMVLGGYIASKHRWAQTKLAELEPRYARLRGLDMQRDEVEQTLQRALHIRSSYVYPSAQDAVQTGNAVQQKVRDLLTNAGLTVVSSQVMPSKEDKGFDRIPLSVRAEGELLAVDSALAVIAEQLPVILVNDVEVRLQSALTNMNEKVAPRLSLQLTLSVLRERS